MEPYSYNPSLDIALLVAHAAMILTGIGIAAVILHDLWRQGNK